MTSPLTFLNPEGTPTPAGHYSQVAVIDAQAAKSIAHLSGQLGISLAGTVSDDLAQEARDLWDNAERALAGAGFPLNSVVKVTQYVVLGSSAAPLAEARTKKLGEHKPGSTLVYVAALARPQYHYEVDIVAAK